MMSQIKDSAKDSKYWTRRVKNNAAARRSREGPGKNKIPKIFFIEINFYSVIFKALQARHKKENQIRVRAAWLEKENIRLRVELLDARQQIVDLNVIVIILLKKRRSILARAPKKQLVRKSFLQFDAKTRLSSSTKRSIVINSFLYCHTKTISLALLRINVLHKIAERFSASVFVMKSKKIKKVAKECEIVSPPQV